jgi:hypothetical protein
MDSPRFARTKLTVLDCAHGYQKEEEDEDQENCPGQGVGDQEAGTKENCKENSEEGGGGDQGCREKESLEENHWRGEVGY